MKLTPKELHEKIDYYAEKEELLKKQSAELEKIVKERTKNLEEKNKELENSKKAMLNLLEDFKEAQEKERLAHESVALQKERAESILNYLQSIAEAVFATDVSENIVFINRTAKSLLPKETRDQVELQKAQDRLSHSIIGLIIVVAAFGIAAILESVLGINLVQWNNMGEFVKSMGKHYGDFDEGEDMPLVPLTVITDKNQGDYEEARFNRVT